MSVYFWSIDVKTDKSDETVYFDSKCDAIVFKRKFQVNDQFLLSGIKPAKVSTKKFFNLIDKIKSNDQGFFYRDFDGFFKA